MSEPSGVIWITGLAGSGKTTFSEELQMKLAKQGFSSIILDGDGLREALESLIKTNNPYTLESRLALSQTYSKLATYIANQRNIVIVATISMNDSIYQLNRRIMKNYIEIFIDRDFSTIKFEGSRSFYEDGTKNVIGADMEYDLPRNAHYVIKNKRDRIFALSEIEKHLRQWCITD